jgi:hypothetical protein
VIDAGLDRENHGSILATAFERGLKQSDARTHPELWTTRVSFP